MENITPTALAEAAQISVPYASQIISGKRSPSLSMALRILHRTGWRHPLLEGFSAAQIKAIGEIDARKASA